MDSKETILVGDDRESDLPKRISVPADLPKGFSVVNLTAKPFSLAKETAEKMAAILLKTGGARLHKGDIWVLATDEMQRDMINFRNIRGKLVSYGFKVAHTASIDPMVLSAVYEQNEQRVEKEAEEMDRTKMMKMYDNIIADALREEVSDIHIERRRSSAQIRMRKHGQLLKYSSIGPKECTDLVAVIHNVLAENKAVTFRENDYQSASVNGSVNSVELKLRYQSLPVYPGGFDVVLRVLPIGGDDETYVELDRLGYSPSQVKMLVDIARRPVGAMVIAGTTGSGKSTTLKNILMWINASRAYRCKIYTIEDPPEYKIPRVSQIPVIVNKDKIKEAGANAISPFYDPLTATMRGDPDILMIGEIRDHFTGDGLKKATQSGHQVLTTVHAVSALGIIDRLLDFGITPSVMGSPDFINGLIYQKLVPVVCPKCSQLLSEVLASSGVKQDDIELARRLDSVLPGATEKIRVRGPGCAHCGGMQVVKRTVCAEVIVPDFQMLKHFRTQKSIEAYEYWRNQADGDPHSDNMLGKTVLEHSLMKVRDGMCSPHDVEELMGPVDGAKKMLAQLRADRDREEEAYNKTGRTVGAESVSQGDRPARPAAAPPYTAADV